uniref:Uncharacterized protein n=1 Tax=Glossina palpalis gambiensis TaxID=67801 RepID=A0A1B0AUM2_9MUSC
MWNIVSKPVLHLIYFSTKTKYKTVCTWLRSLRITLDLQSIQLCTQAHHNDYLRLFIAVCVAHTSEDQTLSSFNSDDESNSS